ETEGLVERKAPTGVQETINARLEILMNKGTIDRNTQLSKFDFPRITQWELDRATSYLGHGPVYRTIGKANGLPISTGHSDIRKEKGGNENLGRCNHLKPRPKKAGVWSCGPVCNKNSGEFVKPSDGLPTFSGSSEIRREESGNENTARGSHQKSRLKKTGCIKPSVKLG
ncbi:hypothetical protein Ancab_004701, partial [Ancistrocladus abbreviatus]